MVEIPEVVKILSILSIRFRTCEEVCRDEQVERFLSILSIRFVVPKELEEIRDLIETFNSID